MASTVFKTKARQTGLLLGKIGLSVLLLYLAVHKLDAASVVKELRGIEAGWFIPLIALAPTTVFLLAWRWMILTFGLLNYSEALSYTWIGLFYGGILPGFVGGDVAKGVSLAARNPSARDSRLPISIVADKMVGLWALVFLFEVVATGLLFTSPAILSGFHTLISVTFVFCATGIAGGVAVCQRSVFTRCQTVVGSIRNRGIRDYAQYLLNAIEPFRGNGALLFKALSVALFLHAINGLIYFFAMRSLGIHANIYFATVFYCLLSVLLSLPVSISGIGVRDAFSIKVITLSGFSAASGAALSWLLLGLSLISVCIGAILQVFELFRRRNRLSRGLNAH